MKIAAVSVWILWI